MDALLRHYERRNIIAKAVVWGLLVALVGLSLDYEVSQLRWPWLHERMLKNMIEGVFVGFLVWVVLTAREKRLRQRFKELGYLNHHIRNSLAVIEMAEGYVSEANERLEMVKNASTRIRRCIEKISREEDCEINEQSPQEP
jgi:broad-specificity NMP kinase